MVRRYRLPDQSLQLGGLVLHTPAGDRLLVAFNNAAIHGMNGERHGVVPSGFEVDPPFGPDDHGPVGAGGVSSQSTMACWPPA